MRLLLHTKYQCPVAWHSISLLTQWIRIQSEDVHMITESIIHCYFDILYKIKCRSFSHITGRISTEDLTRILVAVCFSICKHSPRAILNGCFGFIVSQSWRLAWWLIGTQLPERGSVLIQIEKTPSVYEHVWPDLSASTACRSFPLIICRTNPLLVQK